MPGLQSSAEYTTLYTMQCRSLRNYLILKHRAEIPLGQIDRQGKTLVK